LAQQEELVRELGDGHVEPDTGRHDVLEQGRAPRDRLSSGRPDFDALKHDPDRPLPELIRDGRRHSQKIIRKQ
jgi:hypothetical protein